MADPTAADLTGVESRIAENVAGVLDHLSRVLGALEGGNWDYTLDKIRGLDKATAELAKYVKVGMTGQGKPRPEYLDVGIRAEARHYWLGALLYPVGGRGGPQKSPRTGGRRR